MWEARRLSNPGFLYSIRKEGIKNNNDFQSLDAGWERLVRSQYVERLKRRLPHLLYFRCGLDHCELLMDQDENLAQPLLNDLRARQREQVITMAELDNLLEADYIARVRGLEDAGERYVVVVAALTVDDLDIERARGRADTLETATGVATLALVVGETINPPQWSRAQGQGVTLLQVDA